MNMYAIPLAEIQEYRNLFQQFLASHGLYDQVEIDNYSTNPGSSILYGASVEDDWHYNDYALVTPSNQALVEYYGSRFVDSLNNSRIIFSIHDNKLVLKYRRDEK